MKTNPRTVDIQRPRACAFLAAVMVAFACFSLAPSGVAQSPWGNALSLDGVDDYVNAGAVPLANSSFTVEAWARRQSAVDMDFLLGQGGRATSAGLHFGFHFGSAFVLGFYNDDLFSTASYADTEWHHWAGTYDASTKLRCVYRDGALIASNTASANYQGTGPLFIGSLPFAGDAAFRGEIDDVRLWNEARTQAEIASHMSWPLTGAESNLLAYWKFDEGSGAAAHDSTTNGHDGVLTSGPAWNNSAVPVWNSSGVPIARILSPACPVWADVSLPVQFIVAGIDPDNDLSHCDLYVNGLKVLGKSFSSTNSGTTCTFDYPFMSPGTNTVSFQVVDKANNYSPGAQCRVNVVRSLVDRSFKVLTYNTHLFEDSPVECVSLCANAWDNKNYYDYIRRSWLSAYVKASGADVVALEEVWAYGSRQWIAADASAVYPFSYWVPDNSFYCWSGFYDLNTGLPVCIDYYALTKLPADDWPNRFHTQGAGLMLLSKYPLSGARLDRIPTYKQGRLDNDDAQDTWADKSVLTATVDVDGTPIRVGMSHALTRRDDLFSSVPSFLRKTIVTFQLNGEPYMFATDTANYGHLYRFEDYSYFDHAAQTIKHAAGWKHVYAGPWGSDHIAVTSFQLNGHPYLFGVNGKSEGHIERINDDPSTGWTTMKHGPWGSDHVAVTSFELDGHPYLFGVNGKDEGHIERINDDPSTGWTTMKYGPWGSDHVAVVAFEMQGPLDSGPHPYLFGVNARNEAHIERIDDVPTNLWMTIKYGYMPSTVTTVATFQLNDHPYLFAVNGQDAWISRVADDPANGWSTVVSNTFIADSYATAAFALNGQPHLFTLRNCCNQYLDSTKARYRPRDSVLWRVNDNGDGWQALVQFEDMRLIRDATVLEPDGPPAIMMGDFNVAENTYGIMDNIFRKVGAVDAYVEVHGTDAGGATVESPANVLLKFFFDTSQTNRIDFVYVKQSGNGLYLRPTSAVVPRDWKLPPPPECHSEDVSDHYPLIVEFRFQEECKLEIGPTAADGRQLRITGTIGRKCEVQYSPDLREWRSLPPFRLLNSPHLFTDPAPAPGACRFYRVRLLPS